MLICNRTRDLDLVGDSAMMPSRPGSFLASHVVVSVSSTVASTLTCTSGAYDPHSR